MSAIGITWYVSRFPARIMWHKQSNWGVKMFYTSFVKFISTYFSLLIPRYHKWNCFYNFIFISLCFHSERRKKSYKQNIDLHSLTFILSFLFTYIFSLLFFFFMWIWITASCPFISAQRTPFNFLLRKVCYQILSVFAYLQKYWFHLHFWRVVFQDRKISTAFFLSPFWNVTPLPSGL